MVKTYGIRFWRFEIDHDLDSFTIQYKINWFEIWVMSILKKTSLALFIETIIHNTCRCEWCFELYATVLIRWNMKNIICTVNRDYSEFRVESFCKLVVRNKIVAIRIICPYRMVHRHLHIEFEVINCVKN